MKNDVVRARVASDLKHDSEIILGKMGMSMSDAIRIFLSQVCLRNAFPVELKIPNKATLKAMKAPVGNETYHSADDLFNDVLEQNADN